LYFRSNTYGDHYALSSARGDVKPDLNTMGHDTEYERERQQQIMENRRLFEDVGLGQQTVGHSLSLLHFNLGTKTDGQYRQQREVSGVNRARKPKTKRQSAYKGPGT
jgi:hypothetical protein